jgi:hypothetical protein
MKTFSGTVKHFFNEFEDTILIISWMQDISFLQDMLIDV